MLEINHLENQEFFIEVQQRVVIVDRPKVYTQVKIFGKWVNLDGRDYNSFIGFKLK
jgi:expansin (peptidoglycan-binding protein)